MQQKFILKPIHIKNPVAQSSFLSKSLSLSIQHQLNQNNVSWCYIEKDDDFERNEDRATGFLIWMGFSINLWFRSRIRTMQCQNVRLKQQIYLKLFFIHQVQENYQKLYKLENLNKTVFVVLCEILKWQQMIEFSWNLLFLYINKW